MLVALRTLLSAAEKLHWPQPVDYLSVAPEDRERFEAAFLNCLRLQTLCVYISLCSGCGQPEGLFRGKAIHALHDEPSSRNEGLYALEAMIEPIALRFKYHFEGTRQTNRLDKVWPTPRIGRSSSLIHRVSQNGTSLMCSTLYMNTGHSWRKSCRYCFPPRIIGKSMPG